MKKNEKKDFVTREELNERSRISKSKTDQVYITLPKGTKNILIELTGKRPSTACKDIVIEYIKEIEKRKREKIDQWPTAT